MVVSQPLHNLELRIIKKKRKPSVCTLARWATEAMCDMKTEYFHFMTTCLYTETLNVWISHTWKIKYCIVVWVKISKYFLCKYCMSLEGYALSLYTIFTYEIILDFYSYNNKILLLLEKKVVNQFCRMQWQTMNGVL